MCVEGGWREIEKEKRAHIFATNMSDDFEPVAKRTRLSVSRAQSESMTDAGELQKELKTLYEQHDTMMSKCEEMCKLVPNMNQTVNTINKLVSNEGTAGLQVWDMKHNMKKVECGIESAQRGLSNIKQHIENLSIEKLHDDNCIESDECILEMQKVLLRDPLSLERKQTIPFLLASSHHKYSPLHHAVNDGHVKCVKFLLERGADVTSLTTLEDDTILHTLYKADFLFDVERLGILKLLLKYGVSCMFSHNQAGNLAIRKAAMDISAEEFCLLFEHGATLTQLETRKAILRAWECYELPMLKFLFLHSPYQLYLGPSDLCQQLACICYKKMMLKGVPLDLCLEKYLEALKFYKAFGGKFRVTPWLDPNRDLLQFFKRYKHGRHFKGAKKGIKALISNPMSLKEISRLAVRKYIHNDYVENVKNLEVPVDLQPFLRFDDVTITIVPDNFDYHIGDMIASSDDDGQ
ncbi:hypothetical protein B566_EDAN009482 [Ephemera danica]|nr:hypothetical protein B566_EDAN009482 [Ephemera danica]